MNRTETTKKMPRERRDVLAAIAKRRNCYRKHVEAKEQVLAKPACTDSCREVGIGQRYDTSIDPVRLAAAEALERTVLKNPQKFCLDTRSQSSNLVENDSAGLCEFKSPRLADDSTGERAAFMAEKLGFDELARKAGTIDFQNWSITPRTPFVNQAGKLIFPGAAFAGNEQRCIGLRGFFGKLENALRGGAGADPNYWR